MQAVWKHKRALITRDPRQRKIGRRALPYMFFFAATLHVSDYVSYRDVFHAGETLAPLTPGRPVA